ncbi:hypothetical protein RchiOBHm_Chr7g0236941 [Rosa chinensis]|uniref:DUF7870 domain-containing protein n=1 Tax=Rosa chinensis TaxID=74649 RepID=A0A2P6PH22_ROSCH|nr:uncharacterized protein LOC112178356 [Rosa chinensis]PRQ21234.1 hypothetical protein RchiOBHm_Chr7g0236941 [Rosa chinensis]
MAINLVQGFRTKQHLAHKATIGFYPDVKYLVFRIPDSRVLLFLARCSIMAFVIVSVPWLKSLVPTTATANGIIGFPADPNIELVPLIFRDLANEGLIKTRHGEKAVFVSSGNDEEAIQSSQILKDNEMDLISVNDENQQNSINDQSVDFAFVSVVPSAMKFIERTLKVGGIVALQDLSARFHMPSNYKMVYLRKLDATVVAMRKMSSSISTTTSFTRRRLFAEEAKKEALKNLEDVLLEPPRASSGKSSRYLKKTRYLPDLMGDSLEGYPRRVFIDVGLPEKEGGSGTSWFAKNYPTRNKNFEMYKIETTLIDESGKGVLQTGMSGWLEKNVKEEEYVVMKAEAEVVEEMMQGKVMNLVDELFLECKPQGHNGKGNLSTRRAYWQCLALYGQLRDEGVAVHQWWG